MLAQAYRLRRPEEINRVYRRGQYAGTAELAIKVLKTNLPVSRAVIVVPKKISKKAVERNRLRRQLAEKLAANWQTVPAGYDIVVNVRQAGPSLAASLMPALARAGVIKSKTK